MKIFVLTYLFSLNVFAQHFDEGVLDVLLNVQESVAPVKYCSLYFLPGQKNPIEKDYQSCVKALCGEASENKTAIISDSNFEKNLSKDVLKNVKNNENKIKQVVNESIKRKLDVLNELKSFIDSNSIDKLDFGKLDNIYRSKVFNNAFNDYAIVNYNLNQDYKNRVEIQYKFPSWADDNFKKTITEMGNSYLKRFKNPGFDFYSKNEIKQIFLDRLDNVYEQADADTKLKIQTEKENISKKDRLSFMDVTSVRLLLENLEKNDVKEPVYYSGCESNYCHEAMKNYLKNEVAKVNLNDEIEKIQSNQYRESKINSCKAGLYYKYIKLNNETEVKEKMQKALSALNNNVLPMFSAHSQSLIKEQIKKLNISNNYPIGYLPKPVTDFNSEATTFLKQKNNKLSNDSKIDELLNFKNDELSRAMETDPCEKSRASSVWDSVIYDKKQINISEYSCNHNLRGPQIVAHELGHFINYIFRNSANMSQESAEKYLKLRNCVAENFKNEMLISDNKFKTDRETTEEDMADFLAHVAFNNEKEMFSCALLEKDDSGQKYKNLTLIKKELDSHSSAFTRLLMEMNRKAVDVPVSCSKIMDTAEGKLGFNKCLDF